MNHHYEEYDVFVNLQSFHRVCHQIVILSTLCYFYAFVVQSAGPETWASAHWGKWGLLTLLEKWMKN